VGRSRHSQSAINSQCFTVQTLAEASGHTRSQCLVSGLRFFSILQIGQRKRLNFSKREPPFLTPSKPRTPGTCHCDTRKCSRGDKDISVPLRFKSKSLSPIALKGTSDFLHHTRCPFYPCRRKTALTLCSQKYHEFSLLLNNHKPLWARLGENGNYIKKKNIFGSANYRNYTSI